MPSINDSIQTYPLFFEPIYKTALWGGTLIHTLDRNDLPKTEEPIGESWEIVDRPGDQSIISNGPHKGKELGKLISQYPEAIVGSGHSASESFPLLMKIIDAGKDLSLQVHPDEETCKYIEGAEPKTEMWYVLDREEKAQIMAGIKDGVSEEQFREKITDPSVRDLMLSYDAEKGQSYFIKATTMHAIGGGNLIYEIQQNSNTTYRVSDWGRVDAKGNPRELHVNQAMLCLKHQNPEPAVAPDFDLQAPKFTPLGDNPTLNIRQLANCNFFQVEEITFQGRISYKNTGESFTSFYAVNANVDILHQGKTYTLEHGKSCLIPATSGEYSIIAKEKCTILKSNL